MTKRPYAVFDIDGTLIRWQLYHAIADLLVRSNIIDVKAYDTVLQARWNWKNRQGINSFSDYESTLVSLINDSVKGLNHKVFIQACRDVFSKHQDQVYSFTRDLIDKLKKQNYLIFALSGSPVEIVKLVADYYKLDAYDGSIYEVKNGHLTGVQFPMLKHEKAEKLKQLIKQFNALHEGSIAVGDTATDIEMLETAAKAIAFNPNQDLFNIARVKGWDIVVERKNMIYQLNYKDGQYILAATDR